MAEKRKVLAASEDSENSEERLAALLEQHKPYLQKESDGRIRCTFNEHVMPAKADVVETFVSGEKFQRRKKQAEEASSFKKYEPFLIESKNEPSKLYCAMTCMLVNKSADSIRRHLKGRAFLKAKERYERDEHELMEEPDLEDLEESEGEEEASQQPSGLVGSLEAMDLEPTGAALDGQRRAETDANTAAGPDESFLEQSKGGKKKAKRSAKQKQTAEDLPQPQTPPQQKHATDSNTLPSDARKKKRVRANGSRPKRIKISEP